VLISAVVGGAAGFWAGRLTAGGDPFSTWFERVAKNNNSVPNDSDVAGKVVTLDQESAVITAVEKVSPGVVSIIVTKDLPVIERYYSNPGSGNDLFDQFFGGDFFGFQQPQYRQKGTEKKEVGGGTGFIVSKDGYILTNKHVVSDEEAEYTVLMNDGKKITAKVLARDQVNDLAVLKIDGNDFQALEMGDSSKIKVGQSVIAIGNSLGEFRNTVSTGVVSGLSRSITAGGSGVGSEQLSGVIQTDASINPGNSGGPLLNISGQVIGINTAMAQGAENIGFTIPINEVKSVYESVKKNGRIIRPWLGIRYALIDKEVAKSNKLDVDYGALVVRGDKQTDLAVVPGSPADKAGIEENDILLEINGQKIDENNPLTKLVAKYQVGEEINLKIMRKGAKKDIKVKLEEMK